MNHSATRLLAGLVSLCALSTVNGQENKEQITKQFTLPHGAAASVVAVYNINGSVTVEGYDGDQVLFEVNKTISARNNDQLEAGKQELKLELKQAGDSIIAYIVQPYDSRPNSLRELKNTHVNYTYKLDFVIKVPFRVNLDLATVTNGNVTVSNVAGLLNLSNVTDNIKVTNARSATHAGSSTGNIDISYADNPAGQSSYHTLTGNITVSYRPSFSADLEFRSMMGKLYTDFPETKTLLPSISKNTANNESAGTFKLENNSTIRLGSGGKLFRFETTTGNVYIKKQS